MQQHILAHLDEVRQRKDDMEHLARHDALTGAPNRVMFFDLLRFAISNARRHASQLAVLFIDLDHFKHVNDSYGHGAGDAVLVEVARRLRVTVRESDTVARLSGDEFVVLIQTFDDVQQLKLIAQKLIATMHAPIEYDGQWLTVGLSLGISIFPGDGDNAEDLLHNADVAMYRSKRDGRNTYTFHV
jgi:diguanylate cyclase (GGDEF)-like protein